MPGASSPRPLARTDFRLAILNGQVKPRPTHRRTLKTPQALYIEIEHDVRAKPDCHYSIRSTFQLDHRRALSSSGGRRRRPVLILSVFIAAMVSLAAAFSAAELSRLSQAAGFIFRARPSPVLRVSGGWIWLFSNMFPARRSRSAPGTTWPISPAFAGERRRGPFIVRRPHPASRAKESSRLNNRWFCSKSALHFCRRGLSAFSRNEPASVRALVFAAFGRGGDHLFAYAGFARIKAIVADEIGNREKNVPRAALASMLSRCWQVTSSSRRPPSAEQIRGVGGIGLALGGRDRVHTLGFGAARGFGGGRSRDGRAGFRSDIEAGPGHVR